MKRGKRIQFKNWDCELVQDTYKDNGRIALDLVAWADDEYNEIYQGEPIACCTSNVPDEWLDEGEVAIKDYSENEGMLQCLLDAGVVLETGRIARSGFVTLSICKFVEG
tara:strand:- start:1932 stop:2258 length:327 start_codon:yes stop_codon:yes gene_type:complete